MQISCDVQDERVQVWGRWMTDWLPFAGQIAVRMESSLVYWSQTTSW